MRCKKYNINKYIEISYIKSQADGYPDYFVTLNASKSFSEKFSAGPYN
jgi:hypothetical protein